MGKRPRIRVIRNSRDDWSSVPLCVLLLRWGFYLNCRALRPHPHGATERSEGASRVGIQRPSSSRQSCKSVILPTLLSNGGIRRSSVGPAFKSKNTDAQSATPDNWTVEQVGTGRSEPNVTPSETALPV